MCRIAKSCENEVLPDDLLDFWGKIDLIFHKFFLQKIIKRELNPS